MVTENTNDDNDSEDDYDDDDIIQPQHFKIKLLVIKM